VKWRKQPWQGAFIPSSHTCGCGKRSYKTRGDARKVAKEMRRKGHIRTDAARLSTYRCDTGVWHVGHQQPGSIPNVNDPRLRFLEDT
jgi:hypothetical protein